MRPALFIATLAITFSAATAVHATVAVHGMNQDPIGAASLSVITDSLGNKQLVVSNIGSSGNDGVSIDLKRTNGLWLVYGTPPPAGPGLPPKRLVHRDLAARLYGQSPSDPLHHMIEDVGLSGTGVDLSFELPGTPDAVVELFNGAQMVYSARRGYEAYRARGALHLEGPSVAVDEPGVAVAFRFGRPAVNTALTGCSFEMLRPSPCEVTIDGVAYSATRIKVRFPSMPETPEMRCIEALVHVSSLDDGSPGSGDMAISCKGAPATPVRKKSAAHGLTISGVTGVTLADGGGPGDLQRIRLVPTGGPVAEPAAVSLWGLPPGEPVLSRTVEDISVRMQPSSWLMPAGQSLTFKVLPVSGVAGITGGVVAGIVVAAVIADCIALGPNEVAYRAEPDPDALSQSIELYKHVPNNPEPQLVVANNGGNGVEVRAPRSRSHRALAKSGVVTMGFGFAPGSTVSLDGVPYDADSVVFVTLRPTENLIGFTSEDLLLSPGTQVTLLSTEAVEYSKTRSDGAKAMILSGSATYTSDESDPGVIRNIGSSGNDGVSYMTDGVPSIRMPFAGGLTLDPGAGLQIDADPCDDGECVPMTSLRMRRSEAGQPEVVSLALTSQHHGNPAFQSNSNQGHMVRTALDLDSDGDGLAEVHALPGSSVSFSSIAYRQLSPYRESFQLIFQSPVQIIVNGAPFTINSLEIGYNIGGQPLGSAAPKPKAVSAYHLPPGRPYFRTMSGLGPEAVTVSGTGSDASLANNSIDGFPVLPTWATISGPGKVVDPDGDGPLQAVVLHVRARDAYGNADLREVHATTLYDIDSADDLTVGHVVKGDLDMIPIGSDGLIASLTVAVEVSGQADAKSATLTVTASPGSSAPPRRLVFSHLDIASEVTCEAYMNGVLQSSFPYSGELECSQLPVAMFQLRPLRNGTLLAECRFRAPVVLSSGAIIVVCDEVRLVPVNGYPISKVGEAELSLHGLPPGVPYENFQMARIVPASVILAAPGEGMGALPSAFALSPAWPNPMRLASTVRFALPGKQHVRAVIMDVAGREVVRLTDRDFEAGEHTLRWNGMGEGGAPVPAGLYFVRIQAAGISKVTRLTRLQ